MEKKNEKLNLLPVIVHYIVTEERGSFAEIFKYVQKTVAKKVEPNDVFSAISKLVEYRILKLNEDTTGTFSLQDWKLTEEQG